MPPSESFALARPFVNALLIHNPISGKPERHDALQRAIGELHGGGWRLDIRATERKGHARELAEQAVAAGYRDIIIVGGDGSIGQAADGIVATGQADVRLGIIPLGTGNVFARDVGLPYPRRDSYHAVVEAARIIMAGDVAPVDVGLANGKAFLCWAGCGIDAIVTDLVETRMTFDKRRLPIATYAVALIRQLRSFQPAAMRITTGDGDAIAGRFYLSVASNITLYARYFRLAHDARLNDGALDLIAIDAERAPHFFFLILKLLLLRRPRDPRITVRQVQSLRIESEFPLPVHLDGDPIGFSPFSVEILPRRLPIYLDRRRAAERLTR